MHCPRCGRSREPMVTRQFSAWFVVSALLTLTLHGFGIWAVVKVLQYFGMV